MQFAMTDPVKGINDYRGNDVHGRAFRSPSEIKTVVLGCDSDKDGELNSEEFEACVSIFFYRNHVYTYLQSIS